MNYPTPFTAAEDEFAGITFLQFDVVQSSDAAVGTHNITLVYLGRRLCFVAHFDGNPFYQIPSFFYSAF